jgi:glycosyltransferase involved in cell wall biosynthesis
LVPPGDEAAFSRIVIDLVDRPEERNRLGAAAKRFIEKDYSLDAAVARVERTYCEMMNRCGSGSS